MKTRPSLLKNFYFTSLLWFLFLFYANGQVSTYSDRNFWDHVRFGGAVGLSFGNGWFSGTLAPSALHQFNDYVAMGLGLNGSYAKERDVFSATILGGSVIGVFSPVNELQLSAEFEELNVRRNFDETIGLANDNYWYPALFLGAGYNTGNVTFGLRYDVLYNENKSIYANAYMPFIRVYF